MRTEELVEIPLLVDGLLGAFEVAEHGIVDVPPQLCNDGLGDAFRGAYVGLNHLVLTVGFVIGIPAWHDGGEDLRVILILVLVLCIDGIIGFHQDAVHGGHIGGLDGGEASDAEG